MPARPRPGAASVHALADAAKIVGRPERAPAGYRAPRCTGKSHRHYRHQQRATAVRKQRLAPAAIADRSEEHTSELQSLMRNSYYVFCFKKKQQTNWTSQNTYNKHLIIYYQIQ